MDSGRSLEPAQLGSTVFACYLRIAWEPGFPFLDMDEPKDVR